MDLHGMLKNADPDRYETARRQIQDGRLTVHDLRVTDRAISGQVETQVVRVYKRKPSAIQRHVYQVSLNEYEHSCSCPDWEYRGAGYTHQTSNQVNACKHQLAVLMAAVGHIIAKKQAA